MLGRGIAYFVAEKNDMEVGKNLNSSKNKVIFTIKLHLSLVAILEN